MQDNKQTKMPTILNRELQRALITLRTAAQFGVMYYVKTPTGSVTNMGDSMQLVDTTKAKGKRGGGVKFSRGYSGVYIPILTGMKVGDVAEIPYGEHPPEHFRGGLSAWCTTHWGKQAHSSCLNAKNKTVEVYRYK